MINHDDVSDPTVRLAESLEEVTPVPGPEQVDYKRSAPRSTIMEAVKLSYPGEGNYEGTRVALHDRDCDGDSRILSAYKVSDHGFFKGRSENAVLLVPTADYHSKEDDKPRAVVVVYLTDADPIEDDVLPREVMFAMQKAGGDAEGLKRAIETFWSNARAEHEKGLKAAAITPTTVTTTHATGDEEPVAEPVEPALTLDPVDNQPVQAERREIDLVAADMSAAQYTPITEQVQEAVEAFKVAWPARPCLLGSVIGFGVLEGLVEPESAEAELATALIEVTGTTRRIQAVTCEEVRTDRWRIALFCREAEGRVVTPHTVHLTPGVAGPIYRVTGGRKYPHQVEVLDYVTASFDAAYHLTV